jgi:hypothetical protein
VSIGAARSRVADLLRSSTASVIAVDAVANRPSRTGAHGRVTDSPTTGLDAVRVSRVEAPFVAVVSAHDIALDARGRVPRGGRLVIGTVARMWTVDDDLVAGSCGRVDSLHAPSVARGVFGWLARDSPQAGCLLAHRNVFGAAAKHQ